MTALALTAIDADVSVSPQLEPSAMADLAAAGFKSVINNRPDGEGGPTQPTNAAIEAAARTAGLAYAHLPVHPSVHTAEDVAKFKSLLASLPRPVVAFCRTGTRSTKLFNAARAS